MRAQRIRWQPSLVARDFQSNPIMHNYHTDNLLVFEPSPIAWPRVCDPRVCDRKARQDIRFINIFTHTYCCRSSPDGGPSLACQIHPSYRMDPPHRPMGSYHRHPSANQRGPLLTHASLKSPGVALPHPKRQVAGGDGAFVRPAFHQKRLGCISVAGQLTRIEGFGPEKFEAMVYQQIGSQKEPTLKLKKSHPTP